MRQSLGKRGGTGEDLFEQAAAGSRRAWDDSADLEQDAHVAEHLQIVERQPIIEDRVFGVALIADSQIRFSRKVGTSLGIVAAWQ